MSGMGQVAGEAAVGIGMTLLTGGDDSVEPDMRLGIIDLLDVMGAVAVRTLGRFQIPQCVSFAMEGLRIGFRKILMAGSALVRDLGHKLVLLDFFDLVGGMTILTVR